jgi:hypothetical protein
MLCRKDASGISETDERSAAKELPIQDNRNGVIADRTTESILHVLGNITKLDSKLPIVHVQCYVGCKHAAPFSVPNRLLPTTDFFAAKSDLDFAFEHREGFLKVMPMRAWASPWRNQYIELEEIPTALPPQ